MKQDPVLKPPSHNPGKKGVASGTVTSESTGGGDSNAGSESRASRAAPQDPPLWHDSGAPAPGLVRILDKPSNREALERLMQDMAEWFEREAD